MCERRPLCHKCDDEADVLMLRGSNPTTEPFPFCRDCRGHWRHADDGVAVHWYSARGPQTTVYGAAGSKQYNGITMHLLRPDGELAVCGRVDGAGRKFNVSHTLGEDYRLCRDCLASLGRVRDDMSELAFEDFVGEVFRIGRREGGLVAPREMWLEYPEVTPEQNHAAAEGFEEVDA